jgi:diguanylate cyclase (GGDEF)-like protein
VAGLSPRRITLILLIPVLLICIAVFATARIERDSAVHAGAQAEASELMLTAMLDQETGARGFFETHDTRFLQPWFDGTAAFPIALADSRSLASGSPALGRMLDEQARRAAALHASTAAEVATLGVGGPPPTTRQALAAKVMMDGFRASNLAFNQALTQSRDNALSTATGLSVAFAAAVSGLLLAAAMLLLRRATERQSRRHQLQRELRELLEVSDSEDESQLLLIRHIERVVPGAGAVVMRRNNSDDRLIPVQSHSVDGTALDELVTDELRPRSCMAVRLSHSYERRAGEEPLLRCEACGKIGGDVACEPLLVGGQVIGSVLVAREQEIDEDEKARLRESVIQAAPILANQRNLTLAETRAASDALTGLPNRRAADETLARLAAHAGRTVSPLAVVLLDLDHFKQVNDIHGHHRGDQALAAVAQILAGSLRASDFAARYGGEEFLILLPDTDRLGARTIAEKLRIQIERADLSPIASLTGSFGISVLPDDANDLGRLVRKADRALYAAKAAGRNRVELAIPTGGTTDGLGRRSEPELPSE